MIIICPVRIALIEDPILTVELHRVIKVVSRRCGRSRVATHINILRSRIPELGRQLLCETALKAVAPQARGRRDGPRVKLHMESDVVRGDDWHLDLVDHLDVLIARVLVNVRNVLDGPLRRIVRYGDAWGRSVHCGRVRRVLRLKHGLGGAHVSLQNLRVVTGGEKSGAQDCCRLFLLKHHIFV